MQKQYQGGGTAIWSGSLQLVPAMGVGDWRYVSQITVGDKTLDFWVLVSMLVWHGFESEAGKNWRDALLECLTQYVEEKLEGGSWKPTGSGQEFRADNEEMLAFLKEEIA